MTFPMPRPRYLPLDLPTVVFCVSALRDAHPKAAEALLIAARIGENDMAEVTRLPEPTLRLVTPT